jgi:hypothetical protein
MILNGDTSGSVTVTVPAVAGTNTVTIPAATGTVQVSGNMPAFSYYQSVAQTLSSATFTKLTFTSSNFDASSGMYASSRFTPTVAGYYQINGALGVGASGTRVIATIQKNGTALQYGNDSGAGGSVYISTVSGIIYLNGSTDYVEIWGFYASGQATAASSFQTYFNGCMLRAA